MLPPVRSKLNVMQCTKVMLKLYPKCVLFNTGNRWICCIQEARPVHVLFPVCNLSEFSVPQELRRARTFIILYSVLGYYPLRLFRHWYSHPDVRLFARARVCFEVWMGLIVCLICVWLMCICNALALTLCVPIHTIPSNPACTQTRAHTIRWGFW